MPFFRYDPESRKSYYIMHLTRPGICRDYSCWRLLIHDFRQRRGGWIKKKRMFCSDGTALAEVWQRYIEDPNVPDDAAWEKEVIRILLRAGYRVLR
jgi:hypothetical protein